MGRPTAPQLAEQLRAFNDEHPEPSEVALLVTAIGWTVLAPTTDTVGCERLPGGGEAFDDAAAAGRLLAAATAQSSR